MVDRGSNTAVDTFELDMTLLMEDQIKLDTFELDMTLLT